MEVTLPIVDAHQHFWNLERNYHPWLADERPAHFRYGDVAPLRRNYLPGSGTGILPTCWPGMGATISFAASGRSRAQRLRRKQLRHDLLGFKAIVADLPVDQLRAVFHDNPVRIYRLQIQA